MAGPSKGSKPYFVYELIDPRNGKQFYVGKGKDGRPSQHLREAAKGVNTHKCNKIRAIQADGLEVGINIVKWFRSEDAAYRFEARHIKAIGLGNLTNICPGGRGMVTGDPDLAEVNLIATCIRKTDGFKIDRHVLRLGGERIDIGAALTNIGRNLIAKVIKSRGEQWLIEKLSGRQINLVFSENRAVSGG